ncbi:hypothetical protein AMS62_27340 [Bacillus sp. FJAT-18019]|nr:hypothetical protein AMS62_27340 [Bacillus sp. FJAT-18019]
MQRQIFILVLVLCTTLTGCSLGEGTETTSEESPQQTMLNATSTEEEDLLVIHGIRLGDSKEKVVDKLGYPQSKGKVIETKNNDTATSYKYGELTFGILNDSVASIETEDREYKTASGIGVGSTYIELMNTYEQMNPRESEGREFVYITEQDRFLSFVMGSDEKIEQISYGYQSVFEEFSGITFAELDSNSRQVDVSKTQANSLIEAVYLNDIEAVERLLAEGADPDTTFSSMAEGIEPSDRISVLWYSIYKEYYEIIALLEKHGAKQIKDVQEVRLRGHADEALQNHDLEKMKSLLEVGLDPNGYIGFGQWEETYMSYSSSRNDQEIVDLLLSYGANR